MAALKKRMLDYAGAKHGATRNERGGYSLLDGFLDSFVDVSDEHPDVLTLRVGTRERKKLEQSHPAVRESVTKMWDTKGWTWLDVPVDGRVPEDLLRGLIDRSYELVVAGKDAATKIELELLGRPFAPKQLLRELLTRHGLADRRADVERLAQPALQLVTHKVAEAKIPLGRTKVGGRPDLPPGFVWPRHGSGKPLAFLAQVNLADAATVRPLAGLPKAGLLLVFSVFGWTVEDDLDPQLPEGDYADDWTRCTVVDTATLTRAKVPAGVNRFPAAAVTFRPILTLPDDGDAAAWGAVKLRKAERDRYNAVYWSFQKLSGSAAPNHHLLGHPTYIQSVIDAVGVRGLRLLFQLDSDSNTDMLWGDGGHVYFFGQPAEMKKGDLRTLFTDYQCG